MYYTISLVPPSSSLLWQTGCSWLGADSGCDEHLVKPVLPGICRNRLWEMTRFARKMGGQAVIKPRFRLVGGCDELQLCEALKRFAAKQNRIVLSSLELKLRKDRFVLEPTVCPRTMMDLAAECTRSFDHFGLPPKISELARYRAAGLSFQERKNLETWGNPYVFRQYRFRIHLTSRISISSDQELLYSFLTKFFASACAEPVVFDALCLFDESDAESPMRLLHRFPFSPQISEVGGTVSHESSGPENLYSGYQRRTA